MRDHQQAHRFVAGLTQFVEGVQGARDRQFHVRLSRTQKDIADQQVVQGRGSGRAADRQFHAVDAGRTRREGQGECAILRSRRSRVRSAKRPADLCARSSLARDRDRLAPLQDHAIAIGRAENGRSIGGEGKGGAGRKRGNGDRAAHHSFARACSNPFTGASKASRLPASGKCFISSSVMFFVAVVT